MLYHVWKYGAWVKYSVIKDSCHRPIRAVNQEQRNRHFHRSIVMWMYFLWSLINKLLVTIYSISTPRFNICICFDTDRTDFAETAGFSKSRNLSIFSSQTISADQNFAYLAFHHYLAPYIVPVNLGLCSPPEATCRKSIHNWKKKRSFLRQRLNIQSRLRSIYVIPIWFFAAAPLVPVAVGYTWDPLW